MDRCYYCEKIIWPWQKRIVAEPMAHTGCDRQDFKKSCERLNHLNPDRFNKFWMKDQIEKREKHYT